MRHRRTHGRRRATLAATLAAFSLGTTATAEAADPFGQLFRFGAPGTAAGQLVSPGPIAVDRSDQSIFTADRIDLDPSDAALTSRLQKFSETGTLLGSLSTPDTAETSGPTAGKLPLTVAAAVDPVRHRLYVLRAAAGLDAATPDTLGARTLLVYSTAPSAGGMLVAPADEPTGVVATFTTANTVLRPQGMDVDPVTHDIVIAGEATNLSTVIKRVSETGTVGPAYTNAALDVPPFSTEGPNGVALGPDGAAYVSVTQDESHLDVYRVAKDATKASGFGAAVKIIDDPTPDFGKGILPRVDLQSLPQGQSQASGSAFALSPDGQLAYLPVAFTVNGDLVNAVQGFSTSDSSPGRLYGGGTTSCVIEPDADVFSFATGAADHLAVLDSDGDRTTATIGGVTVFGPNGSGCLVPAARFTVAGDEGAAVTVPRGRTLTFDASSSALAGSKPSEVAWDFNGDGVFEVKSTGASPALTTTHTFPAAGTTQVSLRITLSKPFNGNPPVLTKSVTATVPAPTAIFTASATSIDVGGTVGFDASNSFDPPGGPTPTLKTYKWDFGDGVTQDTTTPGVSHTYTAAGDRVATLTVVNSEDVASTTVPLTIQVIDPAAAGGGGPTDTGGTQTIPMLPGTPTGPGAPPPPPKPLKLAAITLGAPKATSKGVVVRVTCPAGTGGCRGKLVLAAKAKSKKAKPVSYGSASYTIKAGASVSVTIKLTSKAKSALKHSHKLTATVTTTTTNADGKATKKVATVTVKAAKKR